MGKFIAAGWRHVIAWLAVLGSAHVVDDGTGIRDKPSSDNRARLRLVHRRN